MDRFFLDSQETVCRNYVTERCTGLWLVHRPAALTSLPFLDYSITVNLYPLNVRREIDRTNAQERVSTLWRDPQAWTLDDWAEQIDISIRVEEIWTIG
jgi:hypothetical protein